MSATIEATPVEGEVEEITTTTTDAEGKFTLWLEKKDYVVTVTPQDAALPIATVTLSGKEDEMSSDTIVVAEPTVLWGAVFATVDDTETLEAVADVVVRAFETIDGVTSRIGSGTTNEDGAFKLIVPAR